MLADVVLPPPLMTAHVCSAYIVGLSDDAGAAQNLAHAMKIAFAPVPFEVRHISI